MRTEPPPGTESGTESDTEPDAESGTESGSESGPGSGGGRPARRLDRTVGEALGWWAVTRVGIVVLALSAPLLFHRGEGYPDVWQAWLQWDVLHFRAIAEHGYANGEPSGAPLAAFFPGLPAAMAALGWIGIGPVLAGVLISLAASAVAGVSLARLAAHEFPGPQRQGPQPAGSQPSPPGVSFVRNPGSVEGIGARAALMWYAAPVGVFLTVGYTEALFCAFAFPGWLAARRGQWARAAMLVALAATVRVSGIFLAAALVVEFLTSRRRAWKALPWLTLPAVPVVGFMVYLHQVHGTWFAWKEAQEKGWAREFTKPWIALRHTVEAATAGHFPADRADWTWMFRAELVAVLVGLALLTWLLWRRSWGEAFWIAATLGAFATSYWFYSLTRATLLWWSLWIGLAVLAQRHRWLGRLYLAVAVPLAAIWAAAFFTGRWAG